MSEHTNARIQIGLGGRHPSSISTEGSTAMEGKTVAMVYGVALHISVDAAEENEGLANARRIVAAWNAAHDAGLSTEALEAGVVGELIRKLENIANAKAHSREHFEDADSFVGWAQSRARHSLAKAKGEVSS